MSCVCGRDKVQTSVLKCKIGVRIRSRNGPAISMEEELIFGGIRILLLLLLYFKIGAKRE